MTQHRNSSGGDPGSLPEPPPEALKHSETLRRKILETIDAEGGVISFHRYMEMALYEPGLGYYSAGAQKFGEAGDFITAPEMSSLFSLCLADQAAEVLDRLGGGDILEMGAGSGAMAAAILDHLAAEGKLPDRYLILEVSADLRERQARTIEERAPDLLERVEWIEALPERLRGVVLGNEVLDALPVERFRIRGGAVRRLGVARRGQGLGWREMSHDRDLSDRVRAVESELGRKLPEGYESELAVSLQALVEDVGRCLTRGAAVFIDYGLPRREFYMPERHQGTLMCHYRHRAHQDPFLYPGIQDITAWVDFTTVGEAALASGCQLLGFSTQAHFLLGAGIDRHIGGVSPEDTLVQLKLAQEVKLLTLPGEMGERFKVMGFARGDDLDMSGFHFRDLRVRL
ncbi:SAM-dependent MidA family methyltransferase [Natronospira proteinivora]|uniref:SAM-dependent MidA family methyltransferase n=1 Tax=Natronospira proteinivora TaxID=1807133 RepID=A0ABT1GAU6_9GAMM|nr:SAM-dependent methyltransferase [Natronospira proteinivora]MCP1728450.1 SAM-dependent MidA family methyltransferase [Natronospira proteinivora]